MNGLDIAYLNGVGGNDRNAAIKRYATRGYNDQIENEITLLTEGHDFSGVDADDQLASDEAIHSHLVRLYGIVDKCPQLVSGYQEPTNFKRMLGYVLNHWDSAEREDAIDAMAKEEERLIGIGAIQNNWDEEDGQSFYLNGEDAFDADTMELAALGAVKMKKDKRGLFNQLKKISNPKLTEKAADIVAKNPALKKIKDTIRKAIANSRKTKAKFVVSNAGKRIKMLQKNADVKAVRGMGGLLGLMGEDDDLRSIMMGTDLELYGTTSNPDVDANALRNYMLRTHKVINDNPGQLFKNDTEEEITYNAIGSILGNSNTTQNFQASIQRLLAESGLKGLGSIGASLEGFLGATNTALDAKGQKKVDQAKAKYNDLNNKANAAEQEAKRLEDAYKKIANSSDKKAIKNAKKAAEKARKNATNARKKADNAYKNIAKTEKSQEGWTKFRAGAKKVGEKIKEVFKKIWKIIVKINPICLLMRGGLLLALRLNLFKFAARLFPGSVSESEGLKLGLTKEQLQKCRQGYEKSLNLYTKIGGKKEIFDKTLIKGAKRTWGGSEVYSKQELEKNVKNNIKALQTDIVEQEKKMKKEGVQFVSDPNFTYSETKVEQTVSATNGLGAALLAIDEMEHEGVHGFNGLGALGEAITVAAVTTTSGSLLAAIGGILGKLGIKGDWIKKAADGIKKAVKKGKEIVKKVKGKVEVAKKKINDLKEGYQNLKSNVQTALSQVKKGVQQVKQNYNKSNVQQVASRVNPKLTSGSSASSTSSPAKAKAKKNAAITSSTANTYAMQPAAETAAMQTKSVPASSSNNKKLLIGGSLLAVAGLGAYLYNKNKN